ncbi:DUF2163 domain-containing protein [uncultured Methylovirgula sp.]|uniref:DUF2163 domain-containing protein n=1 Tax=uncultured Methylovirgula sp. TaxID=1285960 RepID=UPI00261169ED|nr:DUF2163 domain-containing protein [uncultured Methylovirgula sp.]
MRQASQAVIDLINDVRAAPDAQMIMADCFTFTFADASALYFTNADIDVTVGGTVFLGNSIRVDGLKYKCSVGLSVDHQKITIVAAQTDLIKGTAALAAIANGILDGCFITRARAFLSAWGEPAVGSVVLFKGRVGTVDGVGRTTAQVTVNSDLVLLNIQMPRKLYAPACQWVLYGYGCGLNKENFRVTGTVQSATAASIVASLSGIAADLAQGTLIFTSGANEGVSLTVKGVSGNTLTFAYPLDAVPAAGDTFEAYYGCDLTQSTCAGRFNNLANFLGFPYIPPPTFAA